MKSSLLFRGIAVTAVLGGAAAALAGAGAGAATLTSCIATDSYVYTAQKYDSTNDCVNAYKAVEVVKGSGASATCPPACLMVGDDLYVSTLCPPIPDIATAVDADAGTCLAAIKAQASGGTCDNPAMSEGGADEAGADEAGADEGGSRDGGVGDADAEGVDAADAAGMKDAGPG